MRFVKIIISTLIALLGIVFIIENLDMLKHAVRIRMDLYFFTFQSPDVHLWVIILFCFFLGVFTASLYGIYELYTQRQTIRQQRHNLEILAKELKQATEVAEAGMEAEVKSPEPKAAPQPE
ncbi:MAG: LapA family protein [Deltaproteobacteria bacterium]|jgi:uncharacterized integral membrane protein